MAGNGVESAAMERQKDTVDRWVLSSGRVLYVVVDTIGLNLIDGTVHSGHDHSFDVVGDWSDESPWTPDERAEVADFMIAKWQAFKNRE